MSTGTRDYPPYVENEHDCMWVRRDLAVDRAAVLDYLNRELRIGLPPEAVEGVSLVRMRHYAPGDPAAPDRADGMSDYYAVEEDAPVEYWQVAS